MMMNGLMFSIITCGKCKKEIFTFSDDVKVCDTCKEYNQQKSEMLD